MLVSSLYYRDRRKGDLPVDRGGGLSYGFAGGKQGMPEMQSI